MSNPGSFNKESFEFWVANIEQLEKEIMWVAFSHPAFTEFEAIRKEAVLSYLFSIKAHVIAGVNVLANGDKEDGQASL